KSYCRRLNHSLLSQLLNQSEFGIRQLKVTNFFIRRNQRQRPPLIILYFLKSRNNCRRATSGRDVSQSIEIICKVKWTNEDMSTTRYVLRYDACFSSYFHTSIKKRLFYSNIVKQ